MIQVIQTKPYKLVSIVILLLLCWGGLPILFNHHVAAKPQTPNTHLSSIVHQAIADNKATTIGVYITLLSTNQAGGINENERFDPASLLKLPIMMILLKSS